MGKKNRENKSPVAQSPPSKGQTSPGAIVAHEERTFHRGPLPSPETLQRYDEIIPGLAERIVSAFELQTTHRHALEKKDLDEAIKFREEQGNRDYVIKTRGQICAVGLTVFAFILSTTAALYGHEVFACVLAGGSLAQIITAFIYGKKSEVNEVEETENQEDSGNASSGNMPTKL